jgi:hypothetical protein
MFAAIESDTHYLDVLVPAAPIAPKISVQRCSKLEFDGLLDRKHPAWAATLFILAGNA